MTAFVRELWLAILFVPAVALLLVGMVCMSALIFLAYGVSLLCDVAIRPRKGQIVLHPRIVMGYAGRRLRKGQAVSYDARTCEFFPWGEEE